MKQRNNGNQCAKFRNVYSVHCVYNVITTKSTRIRGLLFRRLLFIIIKRTQRNDGIVSKIWNDDRRLTAMLEYYYPMYGFAIGHNFQQ